MQNAIIIHGTTDKGEYFDENYPSLSNSHWIPWFQKQLLIKGIITQTPEMPEAYKPSYEKWKIELERYEINKETTLAGYSSGGGFLIRWLSENKVIIKKLILVAPWLDPHGIMIGNFFNFEIDENINARIGKIHLFISKDDDEDILKSVDIIKSKIPEITKHVFTDKGHFCFSDMGTDKFPELLESIE